MSRRFLVTAAVVAAVALTGCSAARDPSGGQRTGTVLDRSYSWNGGTFRYPSAWPRASWSEVSTMSFLVGYLSNRPLHDPCRRTVDRTGVSLTCGLPLEQLGPGGVLVSWVQQGGPPGLRLDAQPGVATTVGGRPARIDGPRTASPWCRELGGSREVDAAVAAPPGPHTLWRMQACLADPGSARSAETAVAVARSLRFAT